ncbi:MAG: CoA transferase [Dehalococcoidia bacterium]
MPVALAGIKVVDLSRTGPGQWVTTLLADMGADVTAVEQPGFAQRRAAGGSVRGDFNISVGRNKRSILLNLAGDRGREGVHAPGARCRRHDGELPPRHGEEPGRGL